MNHLPLEIVHRILEYDGRIKYRHGKYMNQIAQDDDRYIMLQAIPQFRSTNSFLVVILRKNTIFYTKHLHPSYTVETSLIEVTEGVVSSIYSCTRDGIRYIWTIYHGQWPSNKK